MCGWRGRKHARAWQDQLGVAPGAGPTCTAAVFAQPAGRFTADFPHESRASLQEYDGSNMAARLRCCTFTADVLGGSLFRHIIACNAVAFGS
jgi:hypothetical protein